TSATNSGTLSTQSALSTPILSWTPSPINLNAPAVLSTNELTASAQAPTGGPVAGSWTYSPAAGSSLSVGTNAVVGTFVPTDLNSYSIGTITNQIVVAAATKLNPTVTVNVGSYTYNGSLQGPGVNEVNKGGSTGGITLQYGGSSSTGAVYGPSSTPPTDAGTYTVLATVAEDANYNQASSSPTAFTIAKGTLVLSGITATGITQGQTLSASTISGTAKNAAGANVAGTWSYQNPSNSPSVGTGNYNVLFRPNDSENYNSANGTASVTVTPSAAFVQPLLAANFDDITSVPNDVQYQTGLPIVSGASPAGWDKLGLDALWLVNHGTTAANWAVMMPAGNNMTLTSGINAN
ncbi:MAG: hypothetical protein EBZ07_09130, partial [Verrucomicrobia bacterium]|nr:hypothetical protein [Verrucomicrobiota bacterium]